MKNAEIEAKIHELKAELDDLHGTTTEVYTRIVGYYRSVKNWNAGKREEYGVRKLYKVASKPCPQDAPAKEGQSAEPLQGNQAVRYELFTRKTCPNCPPVKAFVQALDLDGQHLDVDTEEGLSAARKYGVMASPTVIFFDEQNKEVFRSSDVRELKSRMAVGAPV